MAVLRTVFMGTPDIAAESLRALLGSPDIEVMAVVTQPDQPKGRGLQVQPSPVKELALAEQLAVIQPYRVRDPDFFGPLGELQPDLIAVTAFGQILPQTILDLPRFGCLNVHTSLLPRFRGAAPIQWAILKGETETGVTIMKMDTGMDTGDILAQETAQILPADNAVTLHDRLAKMGAALLVKTIPAWVAGNIQPRPQPAEGVSYAPKIKKLDGALDWREPAAALWNRVRALVPWPGAYTHLPVSPKPHLLKIWRAEAASDSGEPGQVLRADKQGILVGCGAGGLRILELQREGGRRLTPEQFLAGFPLKPGQKLGEQR